MTAARYKLNGYDCGMEAAHDGAWVSHFDYAALSASNEALRVALADIELDIALADGISRGYDLGPALAKIRSLIQGETDQP